MEIIRETIEERPYASKAFESYFGRDWVVLDIETTGLSPRASKVILVGLAFPDGERIRAVQLFARSRAEEEELLLKLNEVMDRRNTVVTYNGASFDLPYLEYRYRAHRIEPTWLPAAGLDLYRAVRSHSPLKDILPNLKQKSVEAYLGLADERTDEISGAESVRLYEEYETFSNPEDRERILLHNRDDIVQLSRLMHILDKLDLHRIVYYEALSALRGDDRAGGGPLIVRKIVPGRMELTVTGVRNPASPDYYGFGPGYSVSMHGEHWKLSIPGETLEGCFVVDLADIFCPDGPSAEGDVLEKIPPVLRESACREGVFLILTAPGEVRFREANALIRAILMNF